MTVIFVKGPHMVHFHCVVLAQLTSTHFFLLKKGLTQYLELFCCLAMGQDFKDFIDTHGLINFRLLRHKRLSLSTADTHRLILLFELTQRHESHSWRHVLICTRDNASSLDIFHQWISQQLDGWSTGVIQT